MKKRISIILILFLLIMVCISTNVEATLNCGVNIETSKTEFAKKEQFEINIKLTNVQTENGIMAFGSVLKYDTNSLKIVEMTGENGWSNPTYNSDNGKFVMDSSSPLTSDAVIAKFKFEVLESSASNLTISLENIEIANGVDTPISASNINKAITITENTSGNNNGNGNSNNSNNNTNNGNTNNPTNSATGNTTSNVTNNSTNNIVNSVTNNTANTTANNTTNINNAVIITNNSSIAPTSNSIISNKSESDLPYTGNSKIFVIIAIVICITISLVYYFKIRKIERRKDKKDN